MGEGWTGSRIGGKAVEGFSGEIAMSRRPDEGLCRIGAFALGSDIGKRERRGGGR